MLDDAKQYQTLKTFYCSHYRGIIHWTVQYNLFVPLLDQDLESPSCLKGKLGFEECFRLENPTWMQSKEGLLPS